MLSRRPCVVCIRNPKKGCNAAAALLRRLVLLSRHCGSSACWRNITIRTLRRPVGSWRPAFGSCRSLGALQPLQHPTAPLLVRSIRCRGRGQNKQNKLVTISQRLYLRMAFLLHQARCLPQSHAQHCLGNVGCRQARLCQLFSLSGKVKAAEEGDGSQSVQVTLMATHARTQPYLCSMLNVPVWQGHGTELELAIHQAVEA